MSKIKDESFNELCLNYWSLTKAHRFGAPKLPPSFSKIIMRGGINYENDYPLNQYFPAFDLLIKQLPEKEQVAFYVVYISSPYRNGRKLPMKMIASELSLSRPNLYKLANEVAIKIWRKTKELTELNSKVTAPMIDDQID